MENLPNIYEIIKPILFSLSPIILIVGIVLILYSNYKRLEDFFGKELFGIKKKVFPTFETNIYVFHEWLLERKTIIGIIFILIAILFLFFFGK